MKKIFALSFVVLVILAGCVRKAPSGQSAPSSSSPQATPPKSSSSQPAKAEGSSIAPKSSSTSSSEAQTPDKAAEELFENVSKLDREQINEIVGQYFVTQQMPEEYFSLLEPITKRVDYKINSSKVNGEKAQVDVSITAVDAQSAINSVMPGAIAHLAAMQLTGKDITNPEKILADYAAKNIDWDKIPTIKTDATLYLVMGADNEWKVDASTPDNLSFANAISGGAIDVAKNVKAFAERYK